MHRIADGVGRDENIAGEARLDRRTQRTCVGDDESEAIAVHGEATGDQALIIFLVSAALVRSGLRQSVAIGVELNQFSGGDQLLKMRVECLRGLRRAGRVRGRAA